MASEMSIEQILGQCLPYLLLKNGVLPELTGNACRQLLQFNTSTPTLLKKKNYGPRCPRKLGLRDYSSLVQC
jgi:hypothetical protein